MRSDAIKDRIRARLDELGLSMKGASQEAGLGETAIRDLLRNENQSPRTDTLEKLAPVLKTTVDWLVSGDNAESDPGIAEVVDIWGRLLSEDDKKDVLDFARWRATQKKDG